MNFEPVWALELHPGPLELHFEHLEFHSVAPEIDSGIAFRDFGKDTRDQGDRPRKIPRGHNSLCFRKENDVDFGTQGPGPKTPADP